MEIAGCDQPSIPRTGHRRHTDQRLVLALDQLLQLPVGVQTPQAGIAIGDHRSALIVDPQAHIESERTAASGGVGLENHLGRSVAGDAPQLDLLGQQPRFVDHVEAAPLRIGDDGLGTVEPGGTVRNGLLSHQPVQVGLFSGDKDH